MQNKDKIKGMIKGIIQAEDEKDNIYKKLHEITVITMLFSDILYNFFKQKKFLTNDEYFSASYLDRNVCIDYYVVSETIEGEPKKRFMFEIEKLSDIIEAKDSKELIERLKEFDCHYGEEES